MKKIQLSRLLMITTIGLLAAFEGYWLNKLYHDEYRNLKKEVDVSFRDVMYQLQNRRLEKDTSIFVQTVPLKVFNRSSSIKKKGSETETVSSTHPRTFIYRTYTPGDQLKNIGTQVSGSEK